MQIKELDKYKYIDICCNASLKGILGRTIEESKENEVLPIIVSGDELGNKTVKKINDNMPFTLGVHPHAARLHSKEYIKNDLYSGEKNCVAIGECGLDYDRMFSPKGKQIEIFEEQIKLAKYYNLPLLLHERKASEDFIKILKSWRCPKGIVHCFTGTSDTVKEYLDLGFYIGITGWICDDRRNYDLKKAVKEIPLDKLMVETDAPYLLPKKYNLVGKNKPKYVKYVVKELAEILGINEEELRKIIFENTKNFFELN